MLPTVEKELKLKSITELEAKVLDVMCNVFYNDYEYWFDEFVDVPFKAISRRSGLKYSTLKGVVGSLVKKEYLKAYYEDREHWVIIAERGLREICNFKI